MPTENGTVRCTPGAGRPDAAVVERLRAAGAVILGKTVTTELAVYHPGKTQQPARSRAHAGRLVVGLGGRGGRGMVPLAIGSQTNGSVIRPASVLRRVRLQADPRPDPRTACSPSRGRSTTSACSRARSRIWP